ncbi:hypothetical protein L1887_18348 [Cichorium endivia]|nr:hypothetical protein L1887_18348 [Cichorium endivia]
MLEALKAGGFCLPEASVCRRKSSFAVRRRKPLVTGAGEGYCSSEGRHGRASSPSPLAAAGGKHQVVGKPSSPSPIKPCRHRRTPPSCHRRRWLVVKKN